tara:strand:+ start:4776 stop:4913 length:138 start_codon:yes stop_codon:yes gene_type:complete
MDPEALANWQKIKEHMEKTGSTNNDFYRRACLIVAGSNDPGPKYG